MDSDEINCSVFLEVKKNKLNHSKANPIVLFAEKVKWSTVPGEKKLLEQSTEPTYTSHILIRTSFITISRLKFPKF